MVNLAAFTLLNVASCLIAGRLSMTSLASETNPGAKPAFKRPPETSASCCGDCRSKHSQALSSGPVSQRRDRTMIG
jgi:hypothetical protein